jgi:4-amino-4-deoxy-L-arabinose transferase-like glycosyltransferase
MLRSTAVPSRSTGILIALLAGTALALFLHLGSYPLLDVDEGRNAAVAREMAETNDYAIPRLNGLPYLDKPIVYFAAQAAFMEVLGPNEFAARLPAALFTLATAALVFWFARREWGSEHGYVAAIVFLTIPITIAFARIVIFDSALTFFITLATMAFYLAVEARVAGGDQVTQRRWLLVAWAAIGFGILTKGPVALLLPMLTVVPYAIRRRAFKALWSIGGIAMFALVIAPWLLAMQRELGDFLQYALITETMERVATDKLQRTGPPWYFLPYALGGALPWSLVLPFAWKRARAEGEGPKVLLLLLLWFALPLIFFSISQSKRPQYIVPLMVPLALLVASQWDSARWRRGVVAAAAAFLFMGLILMIGPMLPPWQRIKPELVAAARVTAVALGGTLLVGGLIAAVMRKRELALAGLALPLIAFPLTTYPVIGVLAQQRSAQELAREMSPFVSRDTDIIGVEAFTGSMTFYLDRHITVVSDDGSEYTSNYVLRRYKRFADRPGSTLRTIGTFGLSLMTCCRPRVYIIRDDDPHHQRVLEALGMRRIAESAHFYAYGPWTGPHTMR